MKLTYYPGCSLEGTARDYAESVQGICSALGIELEEVPDWNCCGATAAHSINHRAGIELAARTLNLAAELPHADMLVPCPMCFNRLKTAAWNLQGDRQDRYQIRLNKRVPRIWDLADYFASREMLQKVAACLKKQLKGLKVVSYYGCMANRPPEITEAANHEDPQSLDLIVRNLGAEPLIWPYKTDCCGAIQALSRPDIVSQLVGKLLDMAKRVGARAIVVSCQMCQANLDMHQETVGDDRGKDFSLPVYYFSDLIGLACNVKGVKKWLSRHITDPFTLLDELRLLH